MGDTPQRTYCPACGCPMETTPTVEVDCDPVETRRGCVVEMDFSFGEAGKCEICGRVIGEDDRALS